MTAPLALPWPDWHTDPERVTAMISGVSDEGLVSIHDQQEAFLYAHDTQSGQEWRVDNRAYDSVFRSLNFIRFVMARRFARKFTPAAWTAK